jgi:hypothetical protein
MAGVGAGDGGGWGDQCWKEALGAGCTGGSGEIDAFVARRYKGRRSTPASESGPVRDGMTPSSSTSLGSDREVEDVSA